MTFAHLQQAKHVLIYGAGTEGKSAERFLRGRFPLLEIDIHDDFDHAHQRRLGWEKYDCIVVSAGINQANRAKIPGSVADRLTSITELFFDNLSNEQRRQVIGISGTKGKSTTTKFCAKVLEAAGYRVAIGGNFGIGFLDLYDDFVGGSYDYIVAELSSYQLESLTISPGIAIFLNFYPDHLDRHQTLDDYWAAKTHLWLHQQPGDRLIVPETWATFLATKDIGQQGQIVIPAPLLPTDYFPVNSIFQAPHLRENLGTVLQLAQELGISDDIVRSVARSFKGLPHRLEYVATKQGIDFYDDSISTNPDSTLPSINFFGERLGCLVIGGQDRGQDFSKLAETLRDHHVHTIVYDSEVAARLVTLLETHGASYSRIAQLGDFMPLVLANTPSGKICLLSCAAPSYDRFKDFAERGDLFKATVNELN